MSSDTDLAQALRELFETWLESRSSFRTTVEVQAAWEGWKANTAVAAMLSAHESRAQPAPSVADYFDKLRRDDNHHLGLGDVRLTLGQQEDVVRMAARAQPASVADIEPMLLALTRGDSTVEEIEARQAIRAAFKKAQPASATDDRAMLLNLMQQFDSQSWECPRCGHGEDCATMDMASELRNYLAAPQPPAKDGA